MSAMKESLGGKTDKGYKEKIGWKELGKGKIETNHRK